MSLDKELLKNLRQAYDNYIAENPTKTAVLDTISPLLVQFDKDGLSIEKQIKILQSGGVKVGYNTLKKWRKLNIKTVEKPPKVAAKPAMEKTSSNYIDNDLP